MNFKLAAEDAADEGIDGRVGAGRRRRRGRGLAVHGRAARRRRDRAVGEDRRCRGRARRRASQAVAAVARRVNERARSFGVALSSCTPPAAGKPIFDLPDGEIELGIGIHGEPGRRREQTRTRAARSSRSCSRRSCPISNAGRGGARAAVRQRHGRHAADRALPPLRARSSGSCGRPGSSPCGTSSAATSPRSRWRARRSPCSSWMTS